jgi:hypothetical protein
MANAFAFAYIALMLTVVSCGQKNKDFLLVKLMLVSAALIAL